MPLTDPARAQGVQLPALDRLTGLTALNLSENTLEEVPPCLSKLTALRFLDLSLNHMLRVRPLNSYATSWQTVSDISHMATACPCKLLLSAVRPGTHEPNVWCLERK